MATQDPRTTIMVGVVAGLGAITKDDGITAATVLNIWQGGTELLKYLFYDTPLGGPYDVIISYGEPRSRSDRDIQDVPVHFLMQYPVTVTTVDQYAAGVLRSTAAEMQYKVTWALRAAIPVTAQSFTGAAPAFTMRLIEDSAIHKRIGGLDVWQATHSIEYETG